MQTTFRNYKFINLIYHNLKFPFEITEELFLEIDFKNLCLWLVLSDQFKNKYKDRADLEYLKRFQN